MNLKNIPADGLAGLKQNFSKDATSGFIVFLLALPLSIGIAKASDFPAAMGILSAIIGGIVVSLFAGSKLTIKGPAAGLIVIAAGAVAEFGQGDNLLGWKLTLGVLFISGLIQILFGFFKFGKFVDFFPLSAVHGMLAAIGIIIIIKQIPVLLDVNPADYKGVSIIGLVGKIPHFFAILDQKATFVGVVSLLIMIYWTKVQHPFLKKVPAALVVLIFAIPAELIMDFKHTEPAYALLQIGDFVSNVNYSLNFEGFAQTALFIKYIIMFALVGSLESLLTIKATDFMDQHHRTSDPNKDLIAVGIGNTIASVFGGLPMISEVARSTANINSGAQTRWANFFHGFFLLAFILVATPLIELIPNSALAAMLIAVGLKLASPKEFIHMFHIGKEQLVIFIVTIIVTILEDLLLGILAGILVKIIYEIVYGLKIKDIFKPAFTMTAYQNIYTFKVTKSAVFTNFLFMKSELEKVQAGANIEIDFSESKIVDHSTLDNLQHFKREFENNGGNLIIKGLEGHDAKSNHGSAIRTKK
jgi:MFS superfamily sulfate permease-like transporter